MTSSLIVVLLLLCASKKVLQQRTSANLISAKQISIEIDMHFWSMRIFVLVIMGGHKLSPLQQALTFKIIKTKEPDET